jgi:hypothetical protein
LIRNKAVILGMESLGGKIGPMQIVWRYYPAKIFTTWS